MPRNRNLDYMVAFFCKKLPNGFSKVTVLFYFTLPSTMYESPGSSSL